jgi:hypothetical protein
METKTALLLLFPFKILKKKLIKTHKLRSYPIVRSDRAEKTCRISFKWRMTRWKICQPVSFNCLLSSRTYWVKEWLSDWFSASTWSRRCFNQISNLEKICSNSNKTMRKCRFKTSRSQWKTKISGISSTSFLMLRVMKWNNNSTFLQCTWTTWYRRAETWKSYLKPKDLF